MARITNIDILKATTSKDLTKMSTSDLRNFLEKTSKSVYDQFRKTEKAVLASNGKLRSRFIEDRAKDGIQAKWRIKRINKSSTAKMNRTTLKREIENLKYAVNQKTFTIKGSEAFTEKINQLGVDYDKLRNLSKEEWSEMRKDMEIYNSEDVISEYAKAESVEEVIDALYENHEMNLEPEEDIDVFDAIKDMGIDPFR